MRSSVEVTITYLEQCEPQQTQKNCPMGLKLAIMRVETPPVHFYRYLYDVVGGAYNWVSRRNLSNEMLAGIIQDENVYLYVLYCDGAPAGMAEIDLRDRDTAEIKFFGFVPEFVGKRLGRYFFSNVVDMAWMLGPKRVILETCTLDPPAALPLYQKLGFSVFDQKKGQVEILDLESE